MEDKGREEREEIPVSASGHHEGSSIDLGTAVLQHRPGICFLVCFVNVSLLLHVNVCVKQIYLPVILQESHPMDWT